MYQLLDMPKAEPKPLPGYAAVANETTIVITKDGAIHVITMAEHPHTFRVVQQALAAQVEFTELEKLLATAS